LAYFDQSKQPVISVQNCFKTNWRFKLNQINNKLNHI